MFIRPHLTVGQFSYFAGFALATYFINDRLSPSTSGSQSSGHLVCTISDNETTMQRFSALIIWKAFRISGSEHMEVTQVQHRYQPCSVNRQGKRHDRLTQ